MNDYRVTVYAPATIANIGVGFDMLGVAIDCPGDTVVAQKSATTLLKFSVKTTNPEVPRDITHNIAAQVALNMLETLKPDFGVELTLHKNMPIGSGLGSSGASCVAAALAINALLPQPLSKQDLLPFILAGEQLASGASHADNVAPALFGGACIIRTQPHLTIVPLPIHPSIHWVVLHPHISIITKTARDLLPKTLPIATVTQQLGNLAGFMLGLMQANSELIRDCMVDYIAEPYRTELIPGFAQIKQAALCAGALNCGISGSGPALFAITLSAEIAQRTAQAMRSSWQALTGLNATCYISQTNALGAQSQRELLCNLSA